VLNLSENKMDVQGSVQIADALVGLSSVIGLWMYVDADHGVVSEIQRMFGDTGFQLEPMLRACPGRGTLSS
jgi:hypothetical protein